MRVTVIGHSCLRIETRAGTVLVDPWLSGSCYWRSWWHFPPSAEPDEALLAPDFVYLTHHHFDHFHYPSMRRLDRSARVLVPRFGVDVMAGEVESLGFDRPRELPHGRLVELGEGVRVASFQYGFDDTAFVVVDGDDVIVDLNDAKTRGRALAQIRRLVGRPTLAFKSHSFAQSYPVLYTADDPADLALVGRRTYLDDFADTMAELNPRYAVPFGSMVGFLHPESHPVNEHLVTPAEVVEAVAERGGIPGTEVVTMIPGDTWSSATGFERSDTDWYTDRERHLAELAERHRPALEARAADEAGRTLDPALFDAHLGRFVREVPRLLARRLVDRPVVFAVPSDTATPYWWVDPARGRIGRSSRPPEGHASVITVTEAVLADAISARILHMVHGSMRIRTHLAAGGVRADLGFWGLLMMWEIGYLPLRRRMWRPRLWMAAARRWRELVDQAPGLARRDPVGHLAERFGADTVVDGPSSRWPSVSGNSGEASAQ